LPTEKILVIFSCIVASFVSYTDNPYYLDDFLISCLEIGATIMI